MKRHFFMLLIPFFILSPTASLLAQKSVRSATVSAQRMLENSSDKQIKDFNKKYAKAHEEILKMMKLAEMDNLRYSEIAENALDWVALSDVLRKFPDGGRVQGEKQSAVFDQSDYTPIVTDAREKAALANYNEGRKIITLTTEFKKRQAAISNFEKAIKYSDKYDADATDAIQSIYKEEADRLSQSSSSYDLERALKYYEKAGMDDLQTDVEADVTDALINNLLNKADREVRTGTSYSYERALDKYAKAANLGSNEASIRRYALLQRLHLDVVVCLPVIDNYSLEYLQNNVPEYVQITVNNDARTPLHRLQADIAVVISDDGRRTPSYTLEVYDLRYPGKSKRCLASYPVKDASGKKDPFEEAFRSNRWNIARLITNLK